MANGNGVNGKNWTGWILMVVGMVVAAGAGASVATYGTVRSQDTNITNLRSEVTREFDRLNAEINAVENKLDGVILQVAVQANAGQ